MPDNQLRQRINARIRQLEQRKAIIHHFTPRYKNRLFILDCWCGLCFASPCVEQHDLENLIEFVNSHAACPPKGHS